MVECVFTLDYEIYGDGRGDLQSLVHEPAERLRQLFLRRGVRFVTFVEVAELERIEEAGSDAAIDAVNAQVRDLHGEGFETALHIHPQWYDAVFEHGHWQLDYAEYNLCTLPRPRVVELVDRALSHLRRLVGEPLFTPLAFRAGNWLFQPTATVAEVLAERGIRIDSSVFKGGVQRRHGLDYRPASANADFWRFTHDVNVPDPAGSMIELPIHTRMVPFWKMVTSKRVGLRNAGATAAGSGKGRFERLRDFARLRYPLKLDFCRMTLAEMTSSVEATLREDRHRPGTVRPVVAIGHTKDPIDIEALDRFLSYLASRGVTVSTFASLYPKLWPVPGQAVPGDA